MNDVIKTGKKVFTIAVVVTTIAWSIGFAALVAPLAASAAVPTAPALIKASQAAVYYYGEDGKRYVFPNEKTYKTWYADFSKVHTITDAELADITIGGNVTYKPGAKMVKITTDPKTYAVGANGTLRHVESEAIAKALYGDNWNKLVEDVPDAFFTNYTVGTKVAAAADFDKTAVTAAASTISVDKGLTTTATPVTTGTVSITAETVAAGSVPFSSTDAIAAKFKMAFSGANKTISKIVTERTGLAADANVSGVSVFKGTTQHGTTQSLNSAHQAVFTGLTLSVANGDVITIAINTAATGTATAGHVLNMKVVEIVFAGGETASGLPVTGPALTISSVTIGTAVLYNGALGTRNTTNLTVDTDAKDVVFTQVKITAGSTEGLSIKQVVAIKNGTAGATDVKNIRLKNDTAGTVLGTVASLTAERATFDINITVAKGESVELSILADMNGGAGRTIAFDLHDGTNYKISIIGATYGFGITPTRNNFCAANGTCTAQGINQGYFDVQKSSKTPATGYITLGGSQVTLFAYDITATGEAINVTRTQLTLTPAAGGSAADYTNVTIFDAKNNIVAGPQDGTTATANTAQTLSFTDAYTVPAGVNTYYAKANASSSAVAGETIVVSLPVNSITAKGGTSGKTSYTTSAGATVPPSAAVTANTLTIQGPALKVITASVPIAGNMVVNAQDAIFAYIDLDASASGENVKVTAAMVQDTLGAGTDYSGANNLEIWGDPDNTDATAVSKKLDTTSTTATNAATTTFTFVTPLVVGKGTISRLTLKLDVVANTGTSHKFAVAGAATVTSVGASTNTAITATYDGAGQVQTVQASGALKVTVSADRAVAAQFVAGSTNNAMMSYKLYGQYEAVDVSQFYVATTSGTASADIANVKFYWNGTQIGAVGGYTLDSGGDAVITLAAGTLVVPKDADGVLTIKVDFSAKAALTDAATLEIGVGDGSGDDGDWGANGAASAAAKNYYIVATGQSSGATITRNTINSTANATTGTIAASYVMYLYDGLLTVTLNASSPSGNASTGTAKEVLRVDFTATGDEITVNDAEFVVGGTAAVTGTTAAYLRSSDLTVTYATFAAGTAWLNPSRTPNDFAVSVDDSNMAFDTALVIAAGTTKTLVLIGDTTGAASTKTIQLSIDNPAAANATAGGVEWQNVAANNVDNALTKNLPIVGGTLVY